MSHPPAIYETLPNRQDIPIMKKLLISPEEISCIYLVCNIAENVTVETVCKKPLCIFQQAVSAVSE